MSTFIGHVKELNINNNPFVDVNSYLIHILEPSSNPGLVKTAEFSITVHEPVLRRNGAYGDHIPIWLAVPERNRDPQERSA